VFSFIKRLSLTLVAHLILVQISDLHQSSFTPLFLSPKTLVSSDPKHSFTSTTAIMKSISIVVLSLLASAQASVLSTTNLATVLAGVNAPSVLTIPADAVTAIGKLGTGGVNAAKLSAADTAAINSCTSGARAGNTAAKAGLGGGTGSAGNIAL
jgi:hypothetical protein